MSLYNLKKVADKIFNLSTGKKISVSIEKSTVLVSGNIDTIQYILNNLNEETKKFVKLEVKLEENI